MEPTPEIRKPVHLEAIELPDLIEFGDPAEDGSEEQTPAVANPKDVGRGVDFVVYVENLGCFGVEVKVSRSNGFKDEGGGAMP